MQRPWHTHLECLVTEEVDSLKLLQEPQAVCLVPASREHIKADLATNGVGQVVVSELLTQGFNELGPVDSRGKTVSRKKEHFLIVCTAMWAPCSYVRYPPRLVHGRVLVSE